MRRCLLLLAALSMLQAAMAAGSSSAPASQPAGTAASRDRLARIAAAGALRVCIWPDYHSISFRAPRTQQLQGLDVDSAHALAQALGVTVRFIDSSFARFIDDLLADRCDIAMFGIAPTPARQERVRFAQPYMASDIYLVTTRANRHIITWADLDKPGVVVAAPRGTVQEVVLRERLQHARVLVSESAQSREQDLRAGRVDAYATDFPFTRGLLQNNDWARVVSPSQPFFVTPYAWALAPGDERLLARVNEVLVLLKRDGRLAASARRHGLEPVVLAH